MNGRSWLRNTSQFRGTNILAPIPSRRCVRLLGPAEPISPQLARGWGTVCRGLGAPSGFKMPGATRCMVGQIPRGAEHPVEIAALVGADPVLTGDLLRRHQCNRRPKMFGSQFLDGDNTPGCAS